MDSKFLYFVKKEIFNNIYESFPPNLSPLCFIEDTNEIWFNNHFFQAGHESIRISEMNNIVNVSLSEDSFNIVPGSESISVKSQGKNIIISCDALTKINTDDFLEWKDGKLYHKASGVNRGQYGPKVDLFGTNAVPTFQIEVDAAGHITSIKEKTVTIRDYVEQREADSTNKNRQLLLAEREEAQDDTNITRKANATFNNATGELKVPKMIVEGVENTNVLIIQNGNIIVQNGVIEGKVKGEVEGTATPKIHISDIPDYGGASLYTYGHVKLVDEVSDNPERSSNNTDKMNKNVIALAASPYAVHDYFQRHKMQVVAKDQNLGNVDLGSNWSFGDDFVAKDSKVQIRWTEVK